MDSTATHTHDEQAAIDLKTLLNTEPDLSSSFGVRPGREPYHHASKGRSVEGTNARITLARQPSDIAIPGDASVCDDGYLIARAMLDETVVRTHREIAERNVAAALRTKNGARAAVIGAVILGEPRALGAWTSKARGSARR